MADGAGAAPSGARLPPLRDATWPEVEAATRRVLVIPVGSLEQHGPHLPLDTDTAIAAAVAGEVHALRPEAGLAPAVPVGASGEHSAFPGTLSIGTAALAQLVIELVRHAMLHWGAVLVLNGHGGNVEGLTAAQRVCQREGHRLVVHHLGTQGNATVPPGDAHAGETETSLLLHVAPDRVRTDRLARGVTTPVTKLMPVLRSGGVRAVSPTGILGDATTATVSAGAQRFAALVTAAVAAHDAALLLTARGPRGPASGRG